MTKHPNMEKLRKQLLEWKSMNVKVSLLQFTNYCRLLSKAMQDDVRFKIMTQKSKDEGFSEIGAVLQETVFEHTCLDTPFLGALMMATERLNGTVLNYDVLHLTMLIHDWPEGLEGDIDWSKKTHADDEVEDDAFALLISVLDDDAKLYFAQAYAIVEEAGSAKRGGRNYKEVSLNAQFFCAVEYLGYISRALYEVIHGNFYFVAVLRDHKEALEYFYKKFKSVRKLIDPNLELINVLVERYKDTKYIQQ